MMTKTISTERWLADPTDAYAESMLNTLSSTTTSPADYRAVMHNIGRLLGDKLIKEDKVNVKSKVCIVSTVEDADFLAKGVYESLQEFGCSLYFVCMWNQREIMNGLSVAPILKRFEQPGYETSDEIVVVKSIISGSCVVKTNITALFKTLQPKKIHIVSPVMHIDSEKGLLKEFPCHYASRFDFSFLAKDAGRNEDTGEVTPGIGGNVYNRLGFLDQKDKNRYMPSFVLDFMRT